MKSLSKKKVKSDRQKAKRLIFRFLFSLFALFTIHYSLFAPHAHALVSIGQDKFEEAISKTQYNKESFDFQSLGGLISSTNTMIMGCTHSTCPNDLRSGALNSVGGMLAGLYANPPASGSFYVASLIKKLRLSDPAYAQSPGTGFTALQPILEIWKAFRNLAYFLFVIAFVVTGLLIMFRVKLSPQVTVTIQSALPRIVMALLLITFSYAIAGFLIDFMYILIALAIAGLGPLGVNVAETQQRFLGANFGTITTSFLGLEGGLAVAGRVATELFGGGGGGAAVGAIVGAVIGALIPIANIIAIPVGAAIGGTVGGTTGAAAPIVTAILAILLLFALFRLFIILLLSYVQIVLAVIFGPLQILLDVFPGQNGFGKWFRGLLANILVFPTTVILLIVGLVISANIRGAGQGWSPPPLGVGSVEGMAALISYGLLLLIPQIVTSVKNAVAGPPIINLGAAAGEAVGPAIELAQGTIRRFLK